MNEIDVEMIPIPTKLLSRLQIEAERMQASPQVLIEAILNTYVERYV